MNVGFTAGNADLAIVPDVEPVAETEAAPQAELAPPDTTVPIEVVPAEVPIAPQETEDNPPSVSTMP